MFILLNGFKYTIRSMDKNVCFHELIHCLMYFQIYQCIQFHLTSCGVHCQLVNFRLWNSDYRSEDEFWNKILTSTTNWKHGFIWKYIKQRENKLNQFIWSLYIMSSFNKINKFQKNWEEIWKLHNKKLKYLN